MISVRPAAAFPVSGTSEQNKPRKSNDFSAGRVSQSDCRRSIDSAVMRGAAAPDLPERTQLVRANHLPEPIQFGGTNPTQKRQHYQSRSDDEAPVFNFGDVT
jgi:hypothetical protein